MVSRLLVVLALVLISAASVGAAATVEVDAGAAPRVLFGREKLNRAIRDAGVESGRVVLAKSHDAKLGKEGFALTSGDDATITITGGDDSGVLYGCLELARRVRESKSLPTTINFTDKPVMLLRGPCIGMQKPNLLPGRRVYEYPYTPQSFPFFYDKEHWREYLDFLVENRMNTLYLWNG